jgi:2-polyprenyl-3-methyl-5-hydroxy-6-metoxy-1,4-benzoquinol methylase
MYEEVMGSAQRDQEIDPRAVAFFNSGATDYLDCTTSKPGFCERFTLFERQIEIARRQLGPEPACIDLGCGPGTLALKARQKGFKVLGIDGSLSMLEYARSAAQRLGLDINFCQASLPLDETLVHERENSAELLIASSIVEYIPNDLAFARQCQRLLAPGGIGLISFANSQSIYRAVERRFARTPIRHGSYMTVQHRQHDEGRARQLSCQAGLTTESVYYFGMPSLFYRLWRSSRRPPWLATLFLLVLKRDEGSR